MQRRNREVNIFNISLLDILCGALGAFCFLTLALGQYWKPEPPNVVRAKENTEQLEQKLKDLLQQMQKMSNVPPEVVARLQQMEKEFEALRQQTAQLRAMLQQEQARAEGYRRQAEQAKEESARLRKENDKLKNRNPVTVVMMTMTPPHEIDLYVADPKMDPPDAGKVQGVKWPGDVLYNSVSHTDVWMMRDAPPTDYKVYYKLMNRKGNTSPAVMSGYFMHGNGFVYLPRITIAEEKKVAFVGTIRVKPDYTTEFQVAPEYEALYREQQQARK